MKLYYQEISSYITTDPWDRLWSGQDRYIFKPLAGICFSLSFLDNFFITPSFKNCMHLRVNSIRFLKVPTVALARCCFGDFHPNNPLSQEVLPHTRT